MKRTSAWGWLAAAACALAAGACLVGAVAAWACPGCKEALFEPDKLAQRISTARGYAWSISLLLAVPCGLLATVAALIVRAHRRRGAAQRIDTVGLSR